MQVLRGGCGGCSSEHRRFLTSRNQRPEAALWDATRWYIALTLMFVVRAFCSRLLGKCRDC